MDLALHLGDGMLGGPTLIGYGVVAAVWVVLAAVLARRDLDPRTAPLAGLVAAFVLAAQTIHFAALPFWLDAHLLGGALAALLLGPWVGALCLAAVVLVQALLFADGGLATLGANVTTMALVAPAAGYLAAAGLRRWAARGPRRLFTAALASSALSTVAASASLVLQYHLGGDNPYHDLGDVAGAAFGVPLIVGAGEALVTALAVVALAAADPRLVHFLRTAQPAEAGG